MAQGHDKQSAIGICYTSISKKDDQMSNSRAKRKRILTPAPVGDELPPAIVQKTVTDPEAPVTTATEKDMEGEMGYESPNPLSEDMMYMPTYGATSFADLDNARSEMHVAKTQRLATDDYQMIIENIMRDPSVEDKVAAIKTVSDEFATRIATISKKESPLMELVKSFKAKLTRASINDLPDSDFAYIEPGGKKDDSGKTTPRSLRHFPIHDAAHVRNALARAPQSPFGAKAMAKIHAAAKKMGIHMASEKKDNQAIHVFKDLKGNWRWLGMPTNNFIDRENEIITDAAHKEFIAFLDAHPEQAPLFVPWHVLDAARKSRTDFWDYDNGFMTMSGPLTEDEAGALMAAKEAQALGMSHGFFALEHDPLHKNLITKYRTFEVSDLPLRNAANPWTSLDVLSKENKMDAKKRTYLVAMVGEDAVKTLENQIKQGKDALTVLGVENKEASAPIVPDEVADPAEEDAAGEEVPEEEGEAVKALVGAIKSELGMEALSTLLETHNKDISTLRAENAELKVAIAKLTKSEDEKIAEKIIPAGAPLFWLKEKKASESESTKLSEEDQAKIEKDGPALKEHWLTDALRVKSE
jgi:hypothetical protein